MGTSERNVSYNLRLRDVCYFVSACTVPVEDKLTSRRMVRNDTRSKAHRVQGLTERIDAARGAL